MNASKRNHRGFLAGKKLEAHSLKEMSRQAPRIFPKCLGRTRMFTDEKLYPQYGDLKSLMFKPIHRIRTPQLRIRNELGLEGTLQKIEKDTEIEGILEMETIQALIEATTNKSSRVTCTDQVSYQVETTNLPDRYQTAEKSQQELETAQHLYDTDMSRKAMREARRRHIGQQMMSNLMHANRMKNRERKVITRIERLKKTMVSWWRLLCNAVWVKSGLNVSAELPR